MKAKKNRRCLSFICAVSLVSALIYSPAGRFVAPYSAGVSVQAEGEVVPEGTKTQAMGILLTLLLGNGFRMVGSFADQASGLGDLFDQWVAETQATITAGAIVLGTRFQNGWMKISSDVSNAYNSFSAWLSETFSIPTTGTVDIPVSTSNDGAVFIGSGINNSLNIGTVTTNGVTSYFNISADNDVRLRIYYEQTANGAANYVSYMISQNYNAAVNINGNSYNLNGSSWYFDGTYYYRKTSNRALSDTSIVFSDYGFIYDGVPTQNTATSNAIFTEMLGDVVLDDQILTGESLDLKDGINLDDDQALLLDLSALASYAGVLDQTLTTAQDLIGALTNAIDRSKAEADEDEDAEVVPWDLVDTDTDSKVAPDDITETPPNETGMYKTLGLEKVFPFSIPFDIYYFIKMFNATAQAPEFDIPFVVTGVINERYHVDLSIFDPVAAIFRTMMLVGFIWFLITKTRDFLRS